MAASAQYKVIIVGSGPAGSAAALHLTQRIPELADDLLIIEAKEHPRPKLCGGGITVHGEEQINQLGVELDVPAFTVDKLIFRLNQQDFVVPYPNAMRVIQRAAFDAALARAVQERDLCLHTGERLLDIQPNADGVIVRTNYTQYHANIVIGADGANSTVRRKLRLPGAAGVARLLRVISPVETDQHPQWREKSALFDFSCIRSGIPGYMWHFPCYFNGEPSLNSGIFDSRIVPKREQPHGNFKQTFGHWLGNHDIDPDAIQLEGHPVRWFNPDGEFSRPHVLLTGDAAGVDPLFAEGISYAMEYGAIVAETVEDALNSGNYSFTNYRQRVINSRMGTLLRRRTWAASAIYAHRFPPFWWVFWRFASFAWPRMQQDIGAWLALLPAHQNGKLTEM